MNCNDCKCTTCFNRVRTCLPCPYCMYMMPPPNTNIPSSLYNCDKYLEQPKSLDEYKKLVERLSKGA